MFIITTFNPRNVVGQRGSFNTTFPAGRGKMCIRNHGYLTLIVSINNFASLTTKIPAGASHVYNMEAGYTQVYWSLDQTEIFNTVSFQHQTNTAVVVVEGYTPDEPVPDDTSFTPHLLQYNFLATTINDIVSVGVASLASTSAQSTTLGPFNVTNGLWLTRIVVRFGIPTGSVGFDATLKDINGVTLEFYHINTGTTVAYVINDILNPALRGGTLNGQESFTFATPAVVSGPGYSINMYGVIQ